MTIFITVFLVVLVMFLIVVIWGLYSDHSGSEGVVKTYLGIIASFGVIVTTLMFAGVWLIYWIVSLF